jgi:hypothetical protein
VSDLLLGFLTAIGFAFGGMVSLIAIAGFAWFVDKVSKERRRNG